jgi:hypothetical protein
MATNYPEIFGALAAEFHPDNVRTRAAKGGREVAYITARTVMNRLDDVLGPENWADSYVPGEKSVMCVLTIVLPDGKVISKADAGGFAGMDDAGDDEKSGFSDAFKRAAVKFGIGRYLYNDGCTRYGTAPELAEAPAARETKALPAPVAEAPAAPALPLKVKRLIAKPPANGRDLWRIAKAVQEASGLMFTRTVTDFRDANGYPRDIIAWDESQVEQGGLYLYDVIRNTPPHPATR